MDLHPPTGREIPGRTDFDAAAFDFNVKRFSAPSFEFLDKKSAIGSPLAFSPGALRKYGNDPIADHPTGTGPYRWVERKDNDHITLERNDALPTSSRICGRASSPPWIT